MKAAKATTTPIAHGLTLGLHRSAGAGAASGLTPESPDPELEGSLNSSAIS